MTQFLLDSVKKRLQKIAKNRKRNEATLGVLFSLNLIFAFLVFINLIRSTLSINETTALIIIASSTSFLGVTLLYWVVAYCKPTKSFSAIAEQIEKKTPLYQDSLNVVANLIDQKKEDLNPIEYTLARKTLMIFTEENNLKILQPQRYKQNFKILAFVFVLLSILLTWNTDILKMSYYGLADFTAGTHTYFRIEPGDTRVRVGTTLKITTQLTRESEIGAPVYLHSQFANIPTTKSAMRHLGNNFYEINLYDIQNPMSYYISNHKATSTVFHITTFHLPSILEREMMVEPPAYTELPLQKLQEFEYVSVVENSRIQIKIKPNKPTTVAFKQNNKISSFTKISEDEHLYSFRVKDYTEYTIHMKDLEKNEFETHPLWVIEVIPDLPPTADIKIPQGDKKMQGIESLDIAYFLTDDYGITNAQMIFQTPRNGIITLPLDITKSKKEKNVIIEGELTIDLLNLALQNGDMISYYIKVWDNKDPEKQISTSSVKFITIVPGKVEEEDKEENDSAAQTARLDDLIAELKRIYRATIPLPYEKKKTTLENQATELTNSLGDLRVNASQRFKKLNFISDQNNTLPFSQPKGPFDTPTESTPKTVENVIQTLATEIIKDITNAETATRSIALTPAMQSEIQALQKLNQLAQIIQQEASSSKQQSDDSSESEEQDQKQTSKEEKKEQQKNLEEKKKKIQELLDKLEEAKDKNQVANQQIAKTGEALTESEKKFFSEKKTDIKQDMQQASDQMQTDADFFPIQDQLNKAIQESSNELSSIAKGQKQNATKYSAKTDYFLNQALDQLRAMKEKLDQSAVQNAQNALDDLAQKQSDLQKQTQKAQTKEQQKEASQAQENLKQDLKNAEEQLKKAIQETEANSPEASSLLEQSLEQLQKNSLDQKMGKASKSIFYGLKDKSTQEQSKILQTLEDAKAKMDEAQQKMGDPSKQQLLKALSKLNQLQQKQQDKTEQQKAEELKKSLDEINGKEAPQFLKDTAQLAEQISNNPGQNLNLGVDQLTTEAMNLIEKKLKEMEMSDIIRRRMNQQLPPDVYKKMVEEYFQNLSRKNQ